MSININIKNIEQLKNNYSKAQFQKRAYKIVDATGKFFENQAKRNIKKMVYSQPTSFPRTGEAMRSIQWKFTHTTGTTLKGTTYMGVPYGRYLEEGTGIYHTPGSRTPWFTNFGGKLAHGFMYRGQKAKPFWEKTRKETVEKTPQFINKYLKEI